MAIPAFFQNVALERVKGNRPSALKAVATAAAAGAVTAILTYKALRT
jgi:hypothetical protein